MINITKEEAIEILKEELDTWDSAANEEAAKIRKAYHMAIEALKQSEITYCKDCKRLEYPNEFFDWYLCARTQTIMKKGFDKDKCFCCWGIKKEDV